MNCRLMVCLAAHAASLIFGLPIAASELDGVPQVTDGDSIRFGPTRVRLFGVDAPEVRQTCERNDVVWLCGQESAMFLRELLAGQTLTCIEVDRDRYRRIVATCSLPDGRDVGAYMVAAGMALAYRRYGGALYDAEEGEAKEAHRGLWGGTFEFPWEWRLNRNSESNEG